MRMRRRMEKNMTEGNSLKQILCFAFPLLLGNLFQQLYNLADSIIVGKTLGIDALASVGASGSLNFLIIGFCIGLCSGFAIPVAQTFGAKEYSLMRRYVVNAMALAAGISIAFAVVTALFCRQILVLIRTPENILDGAYRYLIIIFIGIPFTVLYNLAAGILRSLGDSKSPFLFLAISTIINIIGDLVCILVFGMGVEGAAISTIVAQAISGICCVIYMKKRFTILKLDRQEEKLSTHRMKILLGMGVPMGLQFSITAIGSVILQSSVNTLGSTVVAAFTAGTKVEQFTMAPYDALSNTSATRCPQDRPDLQRRQTDDHDQRALQYSGRSGDDPLGRPDGWHLCRCRGDSGHFPCVQVCPVSCLVLLSAGNPRHPSQRCAGYGAQRRCDVRRPDRDDCPYRYGTLCHSGIRLHRSLLQRPGRLALLDNLHCDYLSDHCEEGADSAKS